MSNCRIAKLLEMATNYVRSNAEDEAGMMSVQSLHGGSPLSTGPLGDGIQAESSPGGDAKGGGLQSVGPVSYV